MRDALRSLEAMGIVEIRMGAGGGARIAHGNSNRFADALAIQMALIGVETDDVLQVQGAIESLAAELAARNATPEDLRVRRGLHRAGQERPIPERLRHLWCKTDA